MPFFVEFIMFDPEQAGIKPTKNVDRYNEKKNGNNNIHHVDDNATTTVWQHPFESIQTYEFNRLIIHISSLQSNRFNALFAGIDFYSVSLKCFKPSILKPFGLV